MCRPAFLGSLLAVLLASSPALAQVPPTQPSNPASSKVAEEIAGVRQRFAVAARADEVALLFAPDGAVVPGGTGRVSGREAIRALWQKILAQYSSRLTLQSVRVESSGDLAYDSGDFEETSISLADGKQHDVKGTYLMVFERQPGGEWLILEQVWVAGAPASS